MKTFALKSVALAALIASPLAVQALTAEQDVDGNGSYSLEELQAAVSDMTEDTFAEIDENGDGEVDMTEVETAQSAGLLPEN
ncbi:MULTISPECIES: EF-hand domain-containing protein [Paracoccaceae]|uniref:EF-hand domain-containing protein n=1 Tax=Paracoccaceae TaxID=31989 RepID=UPI002614037C|nr:MULTISPECIES: EF-hand domain-containing protein [Paracoccaceae]MDF1715799.1 EF-hand domain-containing protein [Antarcticimicrobium sp.]MDF1853883.1 EF-hand domain-containing protein [Pseudooceanicola sp.]